MSDATPAEPQPDPPPSKHGAGGAGGAGGGGRHRGMTSWRSAHRSRSHESAHADSDADDASSESNDKHSDHPLIPRGPAPLLVDQASLDALVDELRADRSFAYDTEFIGELSYHPLLCLIQV